VPLEELPALRSSDLLYTGAGKEAPAVLRALGFSAPLRLLERGAAAAQAARYSPIYDAGSGGFS
jgi:hypothetical protein